jgi:hypothetical protein
MKIYVNPRYKDFEKLIRRIAKEVPDVNIKTMDYKGGKKKPSFVYRDTCYRFEKKGELISALQELAAYAAKGGFRSIETENTPDDEAVYAEDEMTYEDSIPVSPEITESEFMEEALKVIPGNDEEMTEDDTDGGDLLDGFGYKGEEQLSYDDSVPESVTRTDTEIIEEALLEADTDEQEVSSPDRGENGDLLDAFDYKGAEEGGYDESVETVTEKDAVPVEEEALDKAGDIVVAEVADTAEEKGNLLDSYGYSGGDDYSRQEPAISLAQPDSAPLAPDSDANKEKEAEYSPIPTAPLKSNEEVLEEALSDSPQEPDTGVLIPEEKKGNLLDNFSYMEGVTLSYDDSIPTSSGKPETEVLEEALKQLDTEPETIELIEVEKGDLLDEYGYMGQDGEDYIDLDSIKGKDVVELSPEYHADAETDKSSSFSYVEDTGEEDILVELGYKEKPASHVTEEDDTITLEIPVEKYNLDELKIRIKFGHFGEPGSTYETRKD